MNNLKILVEKVRLRDIVLESAWLASQAALNYYKNNKWSPLEILFSQKLKAVGIELGRHYLHNYPIFNPETGRFYEIDFLFFSPTYKKKATAVEISPKVWHKNLGKTEEKDRKKKELLEKLGFRVVILTGEDIEQIRKIWFKPGKALVRLIRRQTLVRLI